ncbi:MAG: ABC transporter substrate-binding protein [Nannocystaceae bacterium]
MASRTILGDELSWSGGAVTRSRTVAVSGLADDPRYSPVVGKWGAGVVRLGANPEQMLALAPDLALLASFTSEEYRVAVAPHVQVLSFGAFTGFEAYRRALKRYGMAMGEPALAAELLREFEAAREKIAARRDGMWREVSSRPTCMSWSFRNTAGSGTTFHDAAQLAGCRNHAAMGGVDGHRRVDTEQLLAWNPDYLVIGCGAVACERARGQLAAKPGMAGLAAVREGRVITIASPYLSTTGAGMLELARLIQVGLQEGR